MLKNSVSKDISTLKQEFLCIDVIISVKKYLLQKCLRHFLHTYIYTTNVTKKCITESHVRLKRKHDRMSRDDFRKSIQRSKKIYHVSKI